MAKKTKSNQNPGMLGKFKQTENISFLSVMKTAFSDNYTKNINPGLLETLESSHKLQVTTFDSAAQAVSSLGKVSPEVAIESIHAIERMHTSVLHAQRQESQETRKYLMLAVLAALGGTALYLHREKQVVGGSLDTTVSSTKLLQPLKPKN